MGHRMRIDVSEGNCRLTQCGCGRGSLKIGGRTFLLSSRDVAELAKVFRHYQEKGAAAPPPGPASQMNKLTGERGWADFQPDLPIN